jgi:hypothetical protein
MGDQIQMDGQNVNGQGNSNPPEWFQAFAQQIVAHMTHMTQRMDTIEQQAQEQPQAQPTPSLPPPADPMVPSSATPSSIRPTPAGTAEPEEQAKRPKHRLQELSHFTGKRSEWPTWKDEVMDKLTTDGAAIGNLKEQFAYVKGAVKGTAAKTILAFVQAAKVNGTNAPENLLQYMENVYGDANEEERANNKLNTMVQGNEAFTTFLPKFERTLAEAGGSSWTDQVKINTLKRMLSQELRTSLVYVNHPTAYDDFVRTVQTLASRLAALKPRVKVRTTPAPVTDEMDWQPSVNKVQAPINGNNERKFRAQWVSKDVLGERRANNKCLRCGGNGHFVDSCKLLPARPPQQGQMKVKAMNVKNHVKDDDEEITVVEELNSDTESGKE